MPSPDRIWLSPDCLGFWRERTWCDHDPGECEDCGAAPVEYVRVDVVETARKVAAYARHDSDCKPVDDGPCDCGLNQALAQIGAGQTDPNLEHRR